MIYPFADAHCDYLYHAVNRGYDILSPKEKQMVSLPALKRGNVKLQFFAVWVDRKLSVPYAQQAMEMIDAYHRMLDECEELCEFTPDFDERSGKTACVLTIEGAEAIEESFAALRNYHRLGVRAMTLTWNHQNAFAHPATGVSRRGLKPLGRRAIELMEEIGIALDVSHLSDACIDDVLALTAAPVFASHSNSRSVHVHRRNLCDDHIREIAKRGGVIGVNFYRQHLTDAAKCSSADVVRHIERIAGLGGIGCA
ncbi:MAG: membrane dipeptidase, partial [Clostridia bacterium]|nr:membrane dipeptidase [Clostridia bacterium]